MNLTARHITGRNFTDLVGTGLNLIYFERADRTSQHLTEYDITRPNVRIVTEFGRTSHNQSELNRTALSGTEHYGTRQHLTDICRTRQTCACTPSVDTQCVYIIFTPFPYRHDAIFEPSLHARTPSHTTLANGCEEGSRRRLVPCVRRRAGGCWHKLEKRKSWCRAIACPMKEIRNSCLQHA